MDTRDCAIGTKLIVHISMELAGDRFESERMTPSDMLECQRLSIRGEGQRGKAAVPVVKRYCVSIADTKTRGLVEESQAEGIAAAKLVT